ncbi:MAG: hypothetical protein P1U68_10370 [Verrucomicrobiales bacterium]|nr:hypothetical protein [Verrucomicrobiales bacterium]
MFSTKEFIEASREFVCVRLETFENKEHQALVRRILNGRFENTAFCLLAPDGETPLTRSSRSPQNILGAHGRGPSAEPGSNEEVIAAMKEIADDYSPRGKVDEMVLQDFHSFRQALNVASGDQRLLLFVAASPGDVERCRDTLRPVFAHDEIIGRFHLDFGSAATDASWAENVSDTWAKSGYFIIQADAFGQKGKAISQLPLTAGKSDIAKALLDANRLFAETEERKVYSSHVAEGRSENIFFENEIPYGEDHDGDGEVDTRRSGKGKGKGKG